MVFIPRFLPLLSFLQRSEQYLTSFQTFSHFFRHVKGSPQVTQSLVGRSLFFRIFATIKNPAVNKLLKSKVASLLHACKPLVVGKVAARGLRITPSKGDTHGIASSAST
jgi:hypothetical protein